MNSSKKKYFLLVLLLGLLVLSFSVYIKQNTYSGFVIFPPLIEHITYSETETKPETTYSIPEEDWGELLEILHTSQIADVNTHFEEQRKKGDFKYRKITIQEKNKVIFFLWKFQGEMYLIAPIKSSYIYRVDSDILNILPVNK